MDKTTLNKKIKKVVEEIILLYEEDFREVFSENEMNDVVKHKAQVSKLAVEDTIIEKEIKKYVEDYIDSYIINKLIKKKEL